jgi:hypothetical protein
MITEKFASCIKCKELKKNEFHKVNKVFDKFNIQINSSYEFRRF